MLLGVVMICLGHKCLLNREVTSVHWKLDNHSFSSYLWKAVDFEPSLHHDKFAPSHKMANILTYVQVVPATTDIYSILEIPTDEIHLEDWNLN